MNTHDLVQGSEAWLAYRAQHFNASDAPAMMGVSTKKTRNELLHEMHTGIAREFSEYVQENVIDPGYSSEAQARPLAELIIGEPLYPVVGSLGKFSASFDGLTMDESTTFEHKRLNHELRQCLPPSGVPFDGDVELPAMYCVQLEQQLMVSGATRALFMASEWDGEGLVEERHCWYYPDLELRRQIMAGWSQFAEDLVNYVPPAAEAPAPVGKAPETLPALHIEVRGQVTSSNLAQFKETALAAIRSVNRELTTDQHFADADKSVKWCADVEERLEAAKRHALSQTASIDELFRTMDDIGVEARAVRLELEKLVKARKESLKGEIVAGGITALRDHIIALDKRIGEKLLPPIPADFAGVIKGMRSFKSMRDAVDTELARAKIAANEFADRITVNLQALSMAGHATLFPDRGSLVLKASDDLQAAIASRIAKHEADEAARLEAERARIRAEEEKRARLIEEARQTELRLQEERLARERAAAQAHEDARQAEEARKQQIIEQANALKTKLEDPSLRDSFIATLRPESFVANYAPVPADEPATLKLGDINARLAYLTVTAQNLADLGIVHSGTDKNAKLFKESDWPRICGVLAAHLRNVCHERTKAAA